MLSPGIKKLFSFMSIYFEKYTLLNHSLRIFSFLGVNYSAVEV